MRTHTHTHTHTHTLYIYMHLKAMHARNASTANDPLPIIQYFTSCPIKSNSFLLLYRAGFLELTGTVTATVDLHVDYREWL